METLAGFGAAKVNLYLHVGPPGGDGYHPIDSLMVFADVGDALTLEPAPAPVFATRGPFAAAAPMDDANLAVRAARARLARARLTGVGLPARGFRLHLEKQLPVAAGLGGGSADAAATLRMVNAALGLGLDSAALQAIGLELGADVPACVGSRAVVARGRGERLSAAPRLPPLHAVLANPLSAVSTGAVFAAFDKAPPPGPLEADPPSAFEDVDGLAAWLAARTRNDLEAPARALCPPAGEAVDLLGGNPRALLARMSGSGATAFALCGDEAEAQALAGEIAAQRPLWWVRACRLS